MLILPIPHAETGNPACGGFIQAEPVNHADVELRCNECLAVVGKVNRAFAQGLNGILDLLMMAAETEAQGA